MRRQDTELKAQVAKLTAPEPELPKAGRTRTAKAALDRGHDRGPVTCVAGAGGKCKAQLTAEDLETYSAVARTSPPSRAASSRRRISPWSSRSGKARAW